MPAQKQVPSSLIACDPEINLDSESLSRALCGSDPMRLIGSVERCVLRDVKSGPLPWIHYDVVLEWLRSVAAATL